MQRSNDIMCNVEWVFQMCMIDNQQVPSNVKSPLHIIDTVTHASQEYY